MEQANEEEAGSGAASSSAAAPAPAARQEQQYCQKYGTKLAAVAKKLLELRVNDPRPKVILFVQFDDLTRK
eukprot:12487166-Heterocapsa_arctica.AAC.1